ncbi:MAG: Pr6Pr family membrane protein [Chloroflexota bacterium]|nr:Pr6Pr family membrane protein [Chloroflexota bacterium]
MERNQPRTNVITIARVAFAVLALVAIVAQFTRSFDDPFLGASNFPFLFTYQSNLMTALVLLVGALRLWTAQADSLNWDLVRGAAVTWMATTGIVHAVLPTSANDTGISYNYAWASDYLHQVMPVVLLLDWLLTPPRHRLIFRHALLWTVYPLAFAGFSLLRGPYVDWYPYPFLDPRDASWLTVGGYVVAIAAGFLVFSWIVVTIGNIARQWWATRVLVAPSP